MRHLLRFGLITGALLLLLATPAYASQGNGGHETFSIVLISLAAFLGLSRLINAASDHWQQPRVLGYLALGIAVTNLTPGLSHTLLESELFTGLSELGAIYLLFELGLESNIQEMRRVGLRSTCTAVIGVCVPFLLGAYLSYLLFPQLPKICHIMMGAAATATSVGVTGSILKQYNFNNSPEGQVTTGAAVIDDILGLLVLTVTILMIPGRQTGSGDGMGQVALAIGFLILTVLVGHWIVSHSSRLVTRYQTGDGALKVYCHCFCLAMAGVAGLAGLAPIIGAFSAGLILDPAETKVVFGAKKSAEHVAGAIRNYLEPLFFVASGMIVDLSTLNNAWILGVALAYTACCVAGKVVSGIGAGKGVNRLLVGVGMVPRGEVGIIFARRGKELGVLDDQLTTIVVVMVALTTLLTPPVYTRLLKRHLLHAQEEKEEAGQGAKVTSEPLPESTGDQIAIHGGESRNHHLTEAPKISK